jgi:hypothetical protein
MINQAPTKEHKMEGRNVLRPIQVATCHGMSNLYFHPHMVLHNFAREDLIFSILFL